jgi:UDP-2,3-diacylglucosamine hydrolase
MHAVIADSHLGQTEGGEEEFHRALAQIRASGAVSLYLLGDIFQYLVGDPRFSTPLTQRFLESIRGLRAQGVRVVYVEGNRDFFLRGSYLEKEFDAVAPEAAFEAGGRRFLLVHGDGINARDWPYRFWRFASKNAAARALLHAIPGPAARRIVSRAERRLRDSNFRNKSRLPVEMIRRYAQKRFHGGYDVLLLGHFHESWRAQCGGGTVEIVPPFLEERRWMEVEPSGESRLRDLAASA